MQGTLNEIDIRSILQLIELGQRTGELFVEAHSGPTSAALADPNRNLLSAGGFGYRSPAPQPNERFWLVFAIDGRIVYAADRSNSNLLRLRDYLRFYQVESALDSTHVPLPSANPLEYAYLWGLMENRILTPAQARNIIKNTIEETLFDLFNLPQGTFNFEMGPALAPHLSSLEISPLTAKIVKQVQQWKQFYPLIQSPNQCPVVTDRDRLQQILPETTLANLESWADGKTSLRQFSRYFNRELLAVSGAIYPYVQQGWIQMSDGGEGMPAVQSEADPFGIAPLLVPSEQKPQRAPQVVCLDDDTTIGKTVESMLLPKGYRASALSEPIEALSQLFREPPDLILCDLAMPNLDGYEICAILRNSRTFRGTPIIILTGKESFIDRVRARQVGATDYLTKPFGEEELLMLLEKYIGLPEVASPPASPSE